MDVGLEVGETAHWLIGDARRITDDRIEITSGPLTLVCQFKPTKKRKDPHWRCWFPGAVAVEELQWVENVFTLAKEVFTLGVRS